jgi:chorismate mutase
MSQSWCRKFILFTLAFLAGTLPAWSSAADCTAESDVTARLACRVASRAAIMQSVALYKSAHARPIYDGRREAEVLRATEADGNDDAALLFAQIQMDLAKQLQEAWGSAEKRAADPAPPPSLDQLRERLDALGAAIAADLAELRSRPGCNRSGLAAGLSQSLSTIGAPLESSLRHQYARMLAAAACSGTAAGG